MREKEILERAFAMPLTSPAYPPGPYRFVNREYLIITYRTDPAKLRAVLPQPLQFDEREAPHALAPVAELPVLEIMSATHILADLTLGLGKVVHDYLRQSNPQALCSNEKL
jgi:acetoacetate decarboxylase